MIGQTIAHYRIIQHLGSGGMGEVYLAEDAKLDRKVALKFLPPQMSAQADAKARFLQEARAASALNHSNVCTIYGIQEHDEQMFIVMEYVEGQTLRDHTQPFTLKQVIEIGIQAADGLAAAHEKGIVHRDIKTENIMIRKDGIVQIMDFGLAKLRGTSRLTKEGSTIGTTGYMSPEQVQGQDADHRTDLFSLGVVLYELVAGQQPFKGVHETAIMYEIVNVDPQPLSAIKPDIDPEFDRIILDCLQKDPDERCQSAKEVARDLRRFKVDSGRKRVSRVSTIRPAYSAIEPAPESAVTQSRATAGTHSVTKAPRSLIGIIPWVLTGILAAALIYGVLRPKGLTNGAGVYRFSVTAPKGQSLAMEGAGNLAISPNGRLIAFVATDSTQTSHLWLRPVDKLVAQQLPGTEEAGYPFWSPDNRFVAFFTRTGKLKKIDVTGGPPVVLCDAASGRGGTWNKKGDIVFAPAGAGGLYRVSSAGGAPTPVTNIDTTRQQSSHRWPWFLPDGNRVLFLVRVGDGGVETPDDTIWVGSLDGSINRPLMQSDGNAVYASGHLLFPRDRTLMARLFDPDAIDEMGDPFPIAEEVYFDAGFNNAVFSASNEGTLSYLSGAGVAGNRIVWYDRKGNVIDTLGDIGLYGNCRLSPGGSHFAINLEEPASGNSDIWVFDLERNVRTRLTFEIGNDDDPVWSPDGRSIYYASARAGKYDLYRKNSSGAGNEELILQTSSSKWPISISSDGTTLMIYGIGGRGTGDDLWSLPIDPAAGGPAGELTPFQQTEFDEDDAHLSPDGRWVAYSSNETGRYDVYVRPFPGPGGKWQISNSGGDFSVWRRDGRELFYLADDGSAMAVDVDGSGSSFKAGEPRKLFSTQVFTTNSPWDVTADGQRFIVVSRGQYEAENAINTVVNWDAEAERR